MHGGFSFGLLGRGRRSVSTLESWCGSDTAEHTWSTTVSIDSILTPTPGKYFRVKSMAGWRLLRMRGRGLDTIAISPFPSVTSRTPSYWRCWAAAFMYTAGGRWQVVSLRYQASCGCSRGVKVFVVSSWRRLGEVGFKANGKRRREFWHLIGFVC